MQTIILYYAKKYIISTINDLFEKNKDNVSKITETISKWIQRLEQILKCLNNLNERCKDNKIEDNEVEDTINEIKDTMNYF